MDPKYERLLQIGENKKEVNMVEFMLVDKRIRTGALLEVPQKSVERALAIIHTNFPNVFAMEHSKVGNVIVCLQENVELVDKITQLNRMSHDETATPTFKGIGGEHTAEFNVLTGEVLGYLTPFDISTPVEGPVYSASIKCRLNRTPLSLFPQVLFGSPEEMEQYRIRLERMVDQMKELHHPYFKVRDIEVDIKARKGGTRKKHKRRRKTKRS